MTALAPVEKTQMARRITRRGTTPSPECWAAVTTDGLWDLQREDSPGTPWLIYHRPSVADKSYVVPVMMCGSLLKCREAITAGWADAALTRCKAEHPKAGWRFLHATQITATSSAASPVPETCEVTAVRNGLVYYRNSTGFRSYTTAGRFPAAVREWIEG